MYLLRKSEYKKINNIINLQENFTFAISVIEEKQNGRIYVDNINEPQSCLIVNNFGKYLVAGNEENIEFRKTISEFLQDKRNHNNYYDLYASSNKWIELLNQELEGNVVKLGRKIYCFHDSENDTSSIETVNLPQGFILKRMNEDLYIKYVNEIDNSYNSLYDSANHFLEEGFGYCILNNNKFVSVCNTFFVSNKFAEIDIMTVEEYRGHGFAFITASVFISHSLKRNLVPYWDADSGNQPSNKLALKLGFNNMKDTNILWWHESKEVIEKYLKNYNYVTP